MTNRFLDVHAPDGTLAMRKASGALDFAGGNAWKGIGTWREAL